MSDATRTLADIAVTQPGATAVFRRHKLDFCCGGQVPLADAAAKKGLDIAALIAELDAAGDGAVDTLPDETPALIDLIETRYHAAHRRDLPELSRLARRVEAVHAGKPDVPAGLADLLERITAELESHMQKEEQILFPLMRRGGHPMIAQPIAVMLAEHDDHAVHLRDLEVLTTDFTPPAGACTTWRALYTGLRAFADDLGSHIHTENNILFPRFARA
jgi:regulator of cell morphogenesis and NO signaling